MVTNLAKYIIQERIKQRLNYAQLAEILGYRNINKGMRRIVEIEREVKADPEILRKVVTALNLDQGYVDKLILEDREAYEAEYERWLNVPVKMSYTVRVMPAVYLNYDLPADIETEDEAITYVSAIAKEKSNLVWLRLDRRTTIFINELGEDTGRHATRAYQSNSHTYLNVI